MRTSHPLAKNLLILKKLTKERQPIFKIYDIFRVKIHVQKIPKTLAFFLNRGRGHGSKVRFSPEKKIFDINILHLEKVLS